MAFLYSEADRRPLSGHSVGFGVWQKYVGGKESGQEGRTAYKSL